MPCKPLPGGGYACSRGTSRGPCSSCGYVIASKLCDYRLTNGKTCDRKLCSHCAVKRAPTVDYCPAHARMADAAAAKEGT